MKRKEVENEYKGDKSPGAKGERNRKGVIIYDPDRDFRVFL
jgi:hypothetical protein